MAWVGPCCVLDGLYDLDMRLAVAQLGHVQVHAHFSGPLSLSVVKNVLESICSRAAGRLVLKGLGALEGIHCVLSCAVHIQPGSVRLCDLHVQAYIVLSCAVHVQSVVVPSCAVHVQAGIVTLLYRSLAGRQ